MTSPDNPSYSALSGLAAFGWNERVAQLMTMFPDRIPGRIVRVDRIRYRVATAHGTTDAYAGPHDRGSEPGSPVTGDWVGLTVGLEGAVELGGGTGALVAGGLGSGGSGEGRGLGVPVGSRPPTAR